MNLEPLSTDTLRKRLAGLRTRRTQWATRVWIHGGICIAFCIIGALYSVFCPEEDRTYIHTILVVSWVAMMYYIVRGSGDTDREEIMEELKRRFEAGK